MGHLTKKNNGIGLKLIISWHFYNFNLTLAASLQQLQWYALAILVNTVSASIVKLELSFLLFVYRVRS